jgi:hypothetical protein
MANPTRRITSLLLAVALTVAVAVLGLSAPASAGSAGKLSVITSRADFDAAFPNLVRENFNDSLAPDGAFAACDAPISSAADNGCFAASALPDGVTFRDDPAEPGGTGLVALGTNFDGNTSDQLTSDTFTDGFVMEFTTPTPVNTFGADLVSHFADDTCAVTVTFVDASTPLATTAPCTRTGTFFGLHLQRAIASVTLLGSATNAEGVDNLRFGRHVTHLKVVRITKNRHTGTATATLRVNSAGTVTLRGPKIQTKVRNAAAPGTLTMKVVRKIPKAGKSTVGATFTFQPTLGEKATKFRAIVLINN